MRSALKTSRNLKHLTLGTAFSALVGVSTGVFVDLPASCGTQPPCDYEDANTSVNSIDASVRSFNQSKLKTWTRHDSLTTFGYAYADDPTLHSLAQTAQLTAPGPNDSVSSDNAVLTEKFDRQVGGHGLADNKPSLIRLADDKSIILKPLGRGYKGEVERRFYAELYDDDATRTTLAGYVPNYIGYTRLPHPNPKRNDTLGYIIFEDDTAQFSKPCIIDIKVGGRTFDDYATATKIRNEITNHSAQSTLGYRITGMRIYDPVTQTYQIYGKQFGRTLMTPEQSRQGLRTFLRRTTELQERDFLLQYLGQTPAECEELQPSDSTQPDINSMVTVLKRAQAKQGQPLVSAVMTLAPAVQGMESHATDPNNEGVVRQVSEITSEQKRVQHRFRHLLKQLDCLSPEQYLQQQLKRLLNHLVENPTHNFYSASVLLAYEGDPVKYLQTCTKATPDPNVSTEDSLETKSNRVPLNAPQHPIHRLPVVLSSKALENFESPAKAKQRTPLSSTTLIDFAHSYRLVQQPFSSSHTRISTAKHYEDTDTTSRKLAEQDSSMFAQHTRDTTFTDGLQKLVQDLETLVVEKPCSSHIPTPNFLHTNTTTNNSSQDISTQALEFTAKLFRDACGISTSKTITLADLERTRPVHYQRSIQAMLKTEATQP